MTEWLRDIRFEDPWLLLLLLLIPAFIWYRKMRKRENFVELRMSSLDALEKNARTPLKVQLFPALDVLRYLAMAAFIIAMARPQTGFSNKRITSEGIDIMLSLDVSPSMYAIDFKPNRMEAAKEAAKVFIDDRPNDRIGLVVFAGESFTQCPATLDHELLKNQVDAADNWQLQDGTAIGDGLFMAVNRLADTTNLHTKVIILLTDGVRMGGKFSPLDAAHAAKQLNVRVYTIGVGTETNRPIPVMDKNGRIIFELDPRISFDEPTLEQIADMTGGRYFKANSKEKLTEVYKEIDQIEKEKVEVDITQRYDEHFRPFVIAGFILLLIATVLEYTWFKTLT